MSFQTTFGAKLSGLCHWQSNHHERPTVILVHGLAGSSESSYMLGIAYKAWHAGFNVVRLDLSHAETSADQPTLNYCSQPDVLRSVIHQLGENQGLKAIWLVGYSLGGNLVLRVAGEQNTHQSLLRGVVAVSPPIDPVSSIRALESNENWFYNRFFVSRLQGRFRKNVTYSKNQTHQPREYSFNTLQGLVENHTLPQTGCETAKEFFEELGATQVLEAIRIPTLLVTAQDDPLVPFHSFPHHIFQKNPFLTLVAPPQGGHCSFIQAPQKDEDLHWAENRVVEFLSNQQSSFHAATSLAIPSC
jgi:hypothetical protein